jgi:hypothetical protein
LLAGGVNINPAVAFTQSLSVPIRENPRRFVFCPIFSVRSVVDLFVS